MPDNPDKTSPATLRFAHAMNAISQTGSTICRRAKWGETAYHVFTQHDADSQMHFLFMGESGTLTFYDPTPEDITSADWQVISLLH
ncbi:Thoeris anti-defense Tad2 family protein [Pantoea agglomerans]|uniref:Thoeris anti-defense Tad2 family protein n=1 Tax=Enterobacter agglomerans TaxID=549 RepID=UPI003C7AAE90